MGCIALWLENVRNTWHLNPIPYQTFANIFRSFFAVLCHLEVAYVVLPQAPPQPRKSPCPFTRRHIVFLLWPDPRVLTIALDIDLFTDPQTGCRWLRYRYQNASSGADNDLLRRLRRIVFLLHFVAHHSTPDGAKHHRDIPAGAATDQTAKTETRNTADNCADAAMVVAGDLYVLDLFDHAATNFHFAGLAAVGRKGGYPCYTPFLVVVLLVNLLRCRPSAAVCQ